MPKIFIVAGIILIAIGLCWNLLLKIPLLGRLPGDIFIQKKNVTFYFPLMTSLVASLIISLLLWIFSKH